MAKLSYDRTWYYPNKLLDKLSGDIADVASVRKEYTRLRDIAQKRLKRMGESMFKETNVYKFNVRHYPKLAQIKSPQELAGRLADLAAFIESPYSTVSKQKKIMKKSIATLHEHEYTFVTEDNFLSFTDFMEEYRAQHFDDIYDSGDAADAYGVTIKHELDPEKVKADFEFWLENIENAKALKRSKKSMGNYDAIKKRVIKKGKVNDNKS